MFRDPYVDPTSGLPDGQLQIINDLYLTIRNARAADFEVGRLGVLDVPLTPADVWSCFEILLSRLLCQST